MSSFEADKEKRIPRGSDVKFIFELIEVWINTINHALIAIATFYITWYSFKVGFHEYQTYHAWYTTIGYQVFMTEGMLAMYKNNTYTKMIGSRRMKTHIHWILQVLGAGFVLFGNGIIIYKRQLANRRHFHNTHGITGQNFFTV